MKIRCTFKDPDALYFGLEEAGIKPQSEEEDKIIEIVYKWFGEYLTVEVDTEVQTCTVLRNIDL